MTWGSSQYGADSSVVADDLVSDVVELTATESAFAARKSNGQVVTWGEAGGDSSSVQPQLLSGVEKVYANQLAFAALKSDGTVVTWGDQEYGGNSRFATGGDLDNIVNIADVFTDTFIGNDFLDTNQVTTPSPTPDTKPLPEPTPDPESYDGIIESVRGRGKLKGTKGADAFTFNSFEAFTKKSADKIIGFNASQGDTIVVSLDAFPALKGVADISFATTNSKKELKQFSKEDYDFVYFEKKGRLYFDGNGAENNWGNSSEGGLLAILKGKPELTAEDITLLA